MDRRHRPDAVAVERVFSQHNVRTVMGTAQASGGRDARAARRGHAGRAAHPQRGEGGGHRQRPGRQGAGDGHGHAAAPAGRGAPARPMRPTRSALAICHVWRGGARRRGSPRPAGARRGRTEAPVIAFVRGRVRARPRTTPSSRSAGSGWPCTPPRHAGRRCGRGEQARLADRAGGPRGLADPLRLRRRRRARAVRAAADRGGRRPAAGAGDARRARARTPLRRALATEDLAALTRVPGIGRKGAQRIVLELQGQGSGARRRSRAPAAAPRPARPVARRRCTRPWSASGWSAARGRRRRGRAVDAALAARLRADAATCGRCSRTALRARSRPAARERVDAS